MSLLESDTEARRVALCLSEVARTLESVDEAPARVQRVLELVRYVVPYERCMVLWAGEADHFVVSPDPDDVDAPTLRARAERLLKLMTDGVPLMATRGRVPSLTLPITGLDQVIGVLSADAARADTFDTGHLRLMSVVASQLGAYLTMLKLREDEARATRELALAHDFQQLLVGAVSHDLRGPLSVITVGAMTMLRKAPDPLQTRALERTLRCAKKANRIIGDLLDVTQSRVQGMLAIQPNATDLKAMLTELADEAKEALGTQVELKLPPGPVMGQWDAGRLGQAVWNLVNNAVQHGETGYPVLIELTAEGDEVRIRVRNAGAPIPRELLPVIFDPFRQGSPQRTRASGKGLGLGLYIVRQIAQAHGGHVSCLSETDGTSFTLTLPIRVPPRERMSPVLVVDDDVDSRALLADALEQKGYLVNTAANGASALEHLRKGTRPLAIIVDLHMPVMDGAALCEACRGDPKLRPIPLFLISGDRARGGEIARKSGTGFLPKPVKIDSLLETIARVG